MSEVGAGEAMAAAHDTRVKGSIVVENGKEYFFAHYPGKSPLREQPILRISYAHMVEWQASVKRYMCHASWGVALIFICTILIVLVPGWVGLKIYIVYKILISVAVPFVLYMLVCWWMNGVEKREMEVRRTILYHYGSTYDPFRVWTVRGKVQGDSEGKTTNADHLLMEVDEKV